MISTSERMKKFEFTKEGEFTAKFQDNECLYEIAYDAEKSLISIFSVSKNGADRKTISSWLMEFEKCTSKDVNMIASDFIDIMAGSTEKNSSNKLQKKGEKGMKYNSQCAPRTSIGERKAPFFETIPNFV